MNQNKRFGGGRDYLTDTLPFLNFPHGILQVLFVSLTHLGNTMESTMQCREPLIPYTSLCSGNGVCVPVLDAFNTPTNATQCLCNEGYGGLVRVFSSFGTPQP